MKTISAFGKWEWASFQKGKTTVGKIDARIESGRQFIRSTLRAMCSELAKNGLRPHIHRPSDSDSRYIKINGYTIRFSDHEPVTILGKKMGGFDTKTGKRHAAADFYFHPGSTEKMVRVAEIVKTSYAEKFSKSFLCGGI